MEHRMKQKCRNLNWHKDPDSQAERPNCWLYTLILLEENLSYSQRLRFKKKNGVFFSLLLSLMHCTVSAVAVGPKVHFCDPCDEVRPHAKGALFSSGAVQWLLWTHCTVQVLECSDDCCSKHSHAGNLPQTWTSLAPGFLNEHHRLYLTVFPGTVTSHQKLGYLISNQDSRRWCKWWIQND